MEGKRKRQSEKAKKRDEKVLEEEKSEAVSALVETRKRKKGLKKAMAEKKSSKLISPISSTDDIIDDAFDVLFNDAYKTKDQIGKLKQEYQNAVPFKHIQLRNFLDSDFLNNVSCELEEEEFVERSTDLFEFQQTYADLQHSKQPHIEMLKQLLYSKSFRNWMQKIVGIQNLTDQVDISAACYSKGSYLGCHDDYLSGRRVAFIIYLVEPDWGFRDGGHLALYSSSATGVPSNVVRTLVPAWNSIAFFNVTPNSFHEVTEVLSNRQRKSISGWFYGPDIEREPAREEFPLFKTVHSKKSKGKLESNNISKTYLQPDQIKKLAKHFAEHSSLYLKDFFETFYANQLLGSMDKQSWLLRGPPNRRHHFVCDNSFGEIENLIQWISTDFCSFLVEVTDINLEGLFLEIRKFDGGCYTFSCGDDSFMNKTLLEVVFTILDVPVAENDELSGTVCFMDNDDVYLNVPMEHNTVSIKANKIKSSISRIEMQRAIPVGLLLFIITLSYVNCGKILIWDCLERCTSSAEAVNFTLYQIKEHKESLSAISYEKYNLGANSTLVLNNLTDPTRFLQSLSLETWPMISSYPYPPGFIAWMRQVFANPQPFIQQCLQQAQLYNFTGFNIDWEPNVGATKADAVDYANFLTTFSNAMHAHNIKVSVDIATWSPVWNFTLLGETTVDLLLDMGTYVGNDTVWLSQFHYAIERIPLSKLAIGLQTLNPDTNTLLPKEQVDFRFNYVTAKGINEVGIWRSPIPPWWWKPMASYSSADTKPAAESQ